MGADIQVEAAQSVQTQTICSTLEDDGAGSVGFDTGADDLFVEVYVVFVADAVVQGDVDGVVGARV